MRKLTKKLRFIWHEIFYFRANSARVEFGMRCKNVVEQIELQTKNQSAAEKLRVILHLSLCQACKNYFDASRALDRAITNKKYEHLNVAELDTLKLKLLSEFSKPLAD